MAVVPMFHANAWGLPYASTLVGAKQVFPGNSMAPDRVLQLMQDERVTLGAGVPTIWIGALPLIQAGKYDLSSMKRIACGGSAAPRGLIEAYDKLGLNILHAWGMTELSPLGTVSRSRTELEPPTTTTQLDFERARACPCRAWSCGSSTATARTLPGTARRWASWSRADRGSRRRTTTTSAAPARSPTDGWFRTGDVVTMQPNGFIEIADRTKDLIKSGGEWISSVALENALMAHPEGAGSGGDRHPRRALVRAAAGVRRGAARRRGRRSPRPS